MDSQLQVKSQPGQGSTFWFDITLPVIESLVKEQSALPGIFRGMREHGVKCWSLTTNSTIRLLLVDMLGPLGFAVDTAENGQVAVDKTLAWQPDVIVIDLVMPVKMGFEAVQEIRQRPELKDVCIIAASASVLEADQDLN